MTRPEETRSNMLANRRATEVLLRKAGNYDMADMVRDNTDRIEAGEMPLRKRGWADEL